MKRFRIQGGKGFPAGRDAARMMRKMGIDMKGLEDVREVIIKRESVDITIKQPEVSMMSMGGQQIFQITGEVIETPSKPPKETLDSIEEDAKIVVEQSGATLEEAIEALKLTGGDLARAILHLKSEKS